jgi:hypothetical protein
MASLYTHPVTKIHAKRNAPPQVKELRRRSSKRDRRRKVAYDRDTKFFEQTFEECQHISEDGEQNIEVHQYEDPEPEMFSYIREICVALQDKPKLHDWFSNLVWDSYINHLDDYVKSLTGVYVEQ